MTDYNSMSDQELLALYQQLKSGAPEGAKARPDYGPGAYETADGAIMRGKQMLKGAQTAGAEARTRLKLGLGPSIQAQKNIFAIESNGTPNYDADNRNPMNSVRATAADFFGGDNPISTRIRKGLQGQELQNYEQAAKSFEASFMPILSGAAVTESEARRMIRANLPEPGDTPQTLNRKARNRAMMVNGAAELLGEPPPFPRVGSMNLKSGQVVQARPPAAPAQRQAPAPSQDGWSIRPLD